MKISLTGENSHIVKIPLGQGSFSIRQPNQHSSSNKNTNGSYPDIISIDNFVFDFVSFIPIDGMG